MTDNNDIMSIKKMKKVSFDTYKEKQNYGDLKNRI